MSFKMFPAVAMLLCLSLAIPAAAQEDITRTSAEVLDESFEDVGTDFDVLIEEEREDILNQRGTGGIGDDILVDVEDPDQEGGGEVSLEDLVDFEVSVRGIPMPPGGGGAAGSESGEQGMPPSGGQSGESGQQGEGGEQGEGGGEGESEGEGEGEEGEGEGEGGEQGEGEEGEQEGQESGGGGGSGGGAGAPGGQQRSGGGGGGSTSPDPDDIPDGQDDDIVARQLRELAEKETDPVLREKLWDEYRRYKAGQ